MPWYYAGPEAKPVGPFSTDELHALNGAGTIGPETFVIEHTGMDASGLAWKRYREIFPAGSSLPAIPGATHPPAAPPPAPAMPAPMFAVPPVAPPLFPSANPAPAHPLFPSSGQSASLPPARPTNAWCAWGFGVSLAGFLSSCLCVGLVPALVGLVLCIVGLVQVNRNRGQDGQGLAIFGLVFSALGLLLALAVIFFWFNGSITSMRGITSTEQTSNDSD